VRIQAVVRELEGEKIDVLKYDPDPRTFIRNALLPAEVEQVVVLDEAKKSALAVVQENNFSLAIGKQGLNVRLANRLVDWNIDVKTAQQFSEMDMSAETKRALSALFGDLEPTEEISRISELPGLNERLVDILKANGIEYIESLISMSEKDIAGLSGVSPDDALTITKAIAENIEVVEESEAKADTDASEAEATKAGLPAEVAAEGALAAATETGSPPAAGTIAPKKARFVPEPVPTPAPEPAPEQSAPKTQGAAAPAEETYECPECGAAIRPDMTACPNCGVGLSFEEDEGQDG
jgi:N utilization substance protein A